MNGSCERLIALCYDAVLESTPEGWGRLLVEALGALGPEAVQELQARIAAAGSPAPEEPEERASILPEPLAEHLDRALAIKKRWQRSEAERRALRDALDQTPYGVILVDRRGGVRRANRAAWSLLERADGLLKDGTDRLACAKGDDTETLRAWIADVAERRHEAGHGRAPLAVRRASMARPLAVLVVPLPGATAPARVDPPSPGVGPATACVLVASPDQEPAPEPTSLTALYGLTPSEARVASRIASGEAPNDIARSLYVSPRTVRNHLQRVFEKTRTRRQNELVRVLLTSVPHAACGA